ncbi:hypothetical protein AJ79_07316 [Helicocarpus griseus UAMH5409]|uniref:Uncharacterized protein n=1 Tax=Helicocarpus griseus UAMH5409 TaxID=1447875 RepID=A0A2B7WW70_9EURO|nr:hypothetical protein AJ79_07316 [Helicocarpus griseus UAMH5409]
MDTPSQDGSSNAITSYLRSLRRLKTSLPHGQLICVSASPNISTMAALLRLANAVGPFIAVLQVHADIIDDWSQEAVRKLSFLAKKYGFLIWEGGRVLNVQKRFGKLQGMSSEEIDRDIDLARKRYTKGVISVAAWAGLASTWVFAPEGQGNGGDRLVPTLRRAARETVAVLTRSVQTEISGGSKHQDIQNGADSDDEDNKELRNGSSLGDSLYSFSALRKGSAISLTQTITQHTEPSASELSVVGENPYSDDEEDPDSDDTPSSPPLYPSPPLLSRGLVLCLPATDDPAFSQEYRQATIATAEAHSNFVIGFVTGESWVEASQITTITGSQPNSSNPESEDEDEDDSNGKGSGEPPCVLFAPLESDHILFPGSENMSPSTEQAMESAIANSVQVYLNVNNGASGGPSPRSSIFPSPQRPASTSAVQHQQINTLHQLVARAIAVRDAKARANGSRFSNQQQTPVEDGTERLCIPIITMNA